MVLIHTERGGCATHYLRFIHSNTLLEFRGWPACFNLKDAGGHDQEVTLFYLEGLLGVLSLQRQSVYV